MRDISGDFEIHLTCTPYHAGDAARFAEQHGLKFSDIELDRGRHRRQPMLTVTARGPLRTVRQIADEWKQRMRDSSLWPQRVKIEAAPWNTGVPVDDSSADAERYFEHHVKLVLEELTASELIAVTELVSPHGARLSRNARRRLPGARHERFVTQRCHGVGRSAAQASLGALTADLRAAGYEIVEIEEEYVVHDDLLRLDDGWLSPHTTYDQTWEDRHRHAAAGTADYPTTYQPLPEAPEHHQRAAFDPALKQYPNAYRHGHPHFADPVRQARWRTVRRQVIAHLLRLLASSARSEHFVLRGSVTLRAWFGDEAREPGDLDFVVVPQSLSAEDPTLLDTVIALVSQDPGPGLRAAEVARDEIWTYERVPGRRLVFPYEHDGLTGSIQLDFVFNEKLPIPPARLPVDGGELLAATPELSLGWKLLWLTTDRYPQGKDLYDAVLLAERTDISPTLVRALLEGEEFTPLTVLGWTVDWQNFVDEYPSVPGDAEHWQQRLAIALERSWLSGSA